MQRINLGFTLVLLATVSLIPWWKAKAEGPNLKESASQSSDVESLDVRLARAHLELAKLDLRRGLEVKKMMPGTIPAALLERLQLHVEIDEERLAQCVLGEFGDAHQVCIRNAEARVKIAKADLKRRIARHSVVRNISSELHVERGQVAVHLAVLNLERAQAINSSKDIFKHLQWQIDELRHQVLELQLESFISARGWSNK